jgi:hypothetical protein
MIIIIDLSYILYNDLWMWNTTKTKLNQTGWKSLNDLCQKADGTHTTRDKVMLEVYCIGLAIWNKRHEMLTSGVVLLHNNMHLHTATCT